MNGVVMPPPSSRYSTKCLFQMRQTASMTFFKISQFSGTQCRNGAWCEKDTNAAEIISVRWLRDVSIVRDLRE